MRVAGSAPISSPTAHRIEQALGVALPREFTRICESCRESGACTRVTDSYWAGQEAGSLIAQTRLYRDEMALPTQYLVLAATNYSVVLLDCADDPAGSGSVQAVPLSELAKLSLGQRPTGARTWPSFAEYFEHVLEGPAQDR